MAGTGTGAGVAGGAGFAFGAEAGDAEATHGFAERGSAGVFLDWGGGR